MRDTRWLTVLDDNTAIFGTPITVMALWTVTFSSSAVDGPLAKRLQALKPDVNCWSVLRCRDAVLAHHLRAECWMTRVRRFCGESAAWLWGFIMALEFAGLGSEWILLSVQMSRR